MPKSTWTISAATGGADSSELIGCKLKETDDGYDFTDPDNDVLASTTNTTLPLSFSFEYDAHTWSIGVTSLTDGPSNNGASGTWNNDDDQRPTGDEEGTWTGQAGGSGEPDEVTAAFA